MLLSATLTEERRVRNGAEPVASVFEREHPCACHSDDLRLRRSDQKSGVSDIGEFTPIGPPQAPATAQSTIAGFLSLSNSPHSLFDPGWAAPRTAGQRLQRSFGA